MDKSDIYSLLEGAALLEGLLQQYGVQGWSWWRGRGSWLLRVAVAPAAVTATVTIPLKAYWCGVSEPKQYEDGAI